MSDNDCSISSSPSYEQLAEQLNRVLDENAKLKLEVFNLKHEISLLQSMLESDADEVDCQK